MGRSIKLKYQTYDKKWKDGDDVEIPTGLNTANINLPCDNCITYITVEIDGQKNNQSFKIETYNEWFDYLVERSEVKDNEYVKIKIISPKNIDTTYRYGGLIIKHNSSPLTAYIELSQEPTIYSLKVEYNDETKGIFRSFPWMKKDNGIYVDDKSNAVFEEKSVTITSKGGSEDWYIKDIEQYEAYDTFTDEAKKNGDKITEKDREKETRVPYDGALNYYLKNKCTTCKTSFIGDVCPNCKKNETVITDKTKLYVKSFGRIDMSNTHMRYYIKISHKDVDNRNAMYLDNEKNPYEISQLFIFDDNKGNKYSDGVIEGTVDTDEGKSYKFMVNNQKSHTISVDANNNTYSFTVLSTENGKDIGYTTSDGPFAKISGNVIDISANDTFSTRECEVVFQQKNSNEKIIVKIIQNAKCSEFVFKVDNKTTDFIYETTINSNGGTYTPTVISTKNDTQIAYNVYIPGSEQWVHYNSDEGIITIDKNNDTNERTFLATFKQSISNNEINVTIKQCGADEILYKYIVHHSYGNVINTENDEVYNKKEGTELTVCSKPLEGYTLVDSKEVKVIVSNKEENNVYTFYYTKNSVPFCGNTYYVVYYVNESGEEIYNSITVEPVPIGTTINSQTVSKATIEGYTFSKTEPENGITLKAGSGNEITCIYKEDIIKNKVTIKAGEKIDSNNSVQMLVVEMKEGKLDVDNPIADFTFIKTTDKKTVELNAKKNYFLYYVSGNGEGNITIKETKGGVDETIEREKGKYVIIENQDGQVVTIDTIPVTYVYELDNDEIIVGWEKKHYTEPYAKLYSYKITNGKKEPIGIKKTEILGDFITKVFYEDGPYSDENGYFYKITVEVQENDTLSRRNGDIKIINNNDKQIILNVQQIKNNEVILTEFDYIVLTYRWKDYKPEGSYNAYSMDFDSVMYFDTPSIGNMYQMCSYCGDNQQLTGVGKIIYDDLRDENGNYVENPGTEKYITDLGDEAERTKKGIYAELAFDQLSASAGAGLNCVETQVIYLKELEKYKYLQQIYEAGDKVLTIQFYGNLYDVTEAEKIPPENRKVEMSLCTYLGGSMTKNRTQKTMENEDGTKKYDNSIGYFDIDSIQNSFGRNIETVKTFTHLGTLLYNLKDKSAVFTRSN